MGIALKPQPCGIFPEYKDARAALGPSMLESEATDLGYTVEQGRDDESMKELEAMVARRWIRKPRSKFLTKRFVRGRVVVSKLVVIRKEKTVKNKHGPLRISLRDA